MVSLLEDYMYWLKEDSTTARALADYDVTNPNLLKFFKDDVIFVLRKVWDPPVYILE